MAVQLRRVHGTVHPPSETPAGPKKGSLGPLKMAPIALPRRWTVLDPLSSDTPKAVSAVLLGATAFGVLAGNAVAQAEEVDSATLPPPDHAAFTRALADLEARREWMSDEELRDARRELWRTYVNGAVASAEQPSAADEAIRARTRMVIEALLDRIEARMTVSAYDVAHPESWEPVEGHPGLKKISAQDLESMIMDALQDVPIGAFPGGHAVAALIKELPNAGQLPAERLSYRELLDALGDAQEQWLREHVLPILQEHKAEVAIIGAGAVAAVIAAGPEALEAVGELLPSIPLASGSWADGAISASSELAFRDGRFNVDTGVRGNHRVGEVDLRVRADTSIDVSADPHLTGALSGGARIGDGRRWVDLSGSIDSEENRRVRLEGGVDLPEEGLSGTMGLGVRYSAGAVPGRASFEISADKRLELNGASGNLGVWAGVEADTDGDNLEGRVGLMLRLRW
jgi:hypothetical protein